MTTNPIRICVKNELGQVFEKAYEADTHLPDAISDAVSIVRLSGHEPHSVILKKLERKIDI